MNNSGVSSAKCDELTAVNVECVVQVLNGAAIFCLEEVVLQSACFFFKEFDKAGIIVFLGKLLCEFDFGAGDVMSMRVACFCDLIELD